MQVSLRLCPWAADVSPRFILDPQFLVSPLGPVHPCFTPHVWRVVCFCRFSLPSPAANQDAGSWLCWSGLGCAVRLSPPFWLGVPWLPSALCSLPVSVRGYFLGRQRGALRDGPHFHFFKSAELRAAVGGSGRFSPRTAGGALGGSAGTLCEVLWLLGKDKAPVQPCCPAGRLWPWVGSSHR